MPMWKVPAPPHEVDKLTAAELETYIGQLRTARQQIKTTDPQNTLLLKRLGEAFAAVNDLDESIRPHVSMGPEEQQAIGKAVRLSPGSASSAAS